MLLALGHPFEPFEQEIAIFERRKHLALGHGIAGARGGLLDEAVIRRHHGSPHQAFDPRIGVNPVGAVGNAQEQRGGDHRGGNQTCAPNGRARIRRVSC